MGPWRIYHFTEWRTPTSTTPLNHFVLDWGLPYSHQSRLIRRHETVLQYFIIMITMSIIGHSATCIIQYSLFLWDERSAQGCRFIVLIGKISGLHVRKRAVLFIFLKKRGDCVKNGCSYKQNINKTNNGITKSDLKGKHMFSTGSVNTCLLVCLNTPPAAYSAQFSWFLPAAAM